MQTDDRAFGRRARLPSKPLPQRAASIRQRVSLSPPEPLARCVAREGRACCHAAQALRQTRRRRARSDREERHSRRLSSLRRAGLQQQPPPRRRRLSARSRLPFAQRRHRRPPSNTVGDTRRKGETAARPPPNVTRADPSQGPCGPSGGLCCWRGKLQGVSGSWLGVALDKPLGHNDGERGGSATSNAHQSAACLSIKPRTARALPTRTRWMRI